MFARLLEGVLVSAGPAADDIANAGEEITEDIDADDRLSRDDTKLIDNPAAFDLIGGRDDHECPP
jgi:hypothetical protein